MKPAGGPVQEIEARRARDYSDDMTLVLKTVRAADRAGAWPGHDRLLLT